VDNSVENSHLVPVPVLHEGGLVRVVVPGPFLEGFDYRIDQAVLPGQRVCVPFGRRQVVGVVEAVLGKTRVPDDQLKSVTEVLDPAPLFSDKLWTLLGWMAEYYHHPLGECLHTAMPGALCAGKPFQASSELKYKSTVHGQPHLLTEEQQAALARVTLGQFSVYLLEGVTGSGKTEVYLQLIDRALQAGLQALVLVPEIALTPQTMERFQQRFAVPIVALHSELTDKQKLNNWYFASTGEARIIIGTRSAVFAPCQRLGIIVIDEEHDLSFKQQSGLHYSAREVAIKRAQLEGIPIVLGSATPSLESRYHAMVSGKYIHLTLTQRAGVAKPPQIYVIDMRQQPLYHGLSRPLLEACQKNLAAGGQVLFFLNRRGYAPVLMCHGCGWAARCPHCERYFTLHLHPLQLLCHHCLTTQTVARQCPRCHSTETLVDVGVGTERLEAALRDYFPQETIVRIDRSVTRRKGELSQRLSEGHSGKASILVGTQMLAKGHHFKGLTLVAIVDADAGLFSSDFRALERLSQLIIQVAGRAGREDRLGEVYLQTHEPTHPLLNQLIQEGYPALARSLLQERAAVPWPPLSYLALFRAASKNHRAEAFLKQAKELLLTLASENLQVLGPVPCVLAKKAGYYQWQLLVQSTQRAALHHALKIVVRQLYEIKSRGVRWSLDVDTQEL